MGLTKYGYDVVVVALILVTLACLLTWYAVEPKVLKYGLLALLLGAFAFTLNFFRDPERTTPAGEDLVLSPADGKVVLVKEVYDAEFIKGEAVQISIFMSPLDVHVNRFPVSGTVAYFKHIPGEHLVAFDDKSSARNERTHIGVEGRRVRVFFKQIAGTVARRIVADLNVGDPAVAGERFGMIRFGSRVDVILPKSCTVRIAVGERTVAGETILAVAS